MTPRPCFWRNALAVSAIGSLVGASPAFAANVTTTTTPSPIVSSTTAVSSTTGVPTPKVILGGGRLLREFSGDALMIDDNYVVVVASPTEHMASIYVESTLKCTGAHSSFRAFFEVKDMKLKVGTLNAKLSPTAPGFVGSLSISLHVPLANLTRMDAKVLSGNLKKTVAPVLNCSASPVSLPLREAHENATAPTPARSPIRGAAYYGAAANPGQRTPFLMHVSADGKEITNRQVELFLDCTAKKPYEFLDLNDFARIPISPVSTFEYRETWTTGADKVGLDPKHRLDISTFTRGAFAGPRAAGVVRFEAKVVDIASGKVLDTCSSGDQSFEATT